MGTHVELDSDIIVSEFELESQYSIHYQSNSLGKIMTLWFPNSNWLNNTSY